MICYYMLPQDPPSGTPQPQRWQIRYPWRSSVLALHVSHHLTGETLYKFSCIFISIEQIKIGVCINMSLLNTEVPVRQLTQHDSLLVCMTDPADVSAWRADKSDWINIGSLPIGLSKISLYHLKGGLYDSHILPHLQEVLGPKHILTIPGCIVHVE